MSTQPVHIPPAPAGATPPALSGWAAFAGVMLLVLGLLHMLWGLAAILQGQNVVVGGQGVIIVSLTAWGWAAIVAGAIHVVTGGALLARAEWARFAAIFIAALTAVGQIGIMTAFPIFSLVVIILAVLVIRDLALHWDGVMTR